MTEVNSARKRLAYGLAELSGLQAYLWVYCGERSRTEIFVRGVYVGDYS
jgi:hypothetical protein